MADDNTMGLMKIVISTMDHVLAILEIPCPEFLRSHIRIDTAWKGLSVQTNESISTELKEMIKNRLSEAENKYARRVLDLLNTYGKDSPEWKEGIIAVLMEMDNEGLI